MQIFQQLIVYNNTDVGVRLYCITNRCLRMKLEKVLKNNSILMDIYNINIDIRIYIKFPLNP
jgi:hypothetical protein